MFEDGDDLDQWLIEGFLAKGKTALPGGAYGMVTGKTCRYSNVPTEDEVRPLFQDEESFHKFLNGDDYSYGLADVTDAEYGAHCTALMSATKDRVQQGVVLDLPTVPHAFLRETPLVEGEWVDQFTARFIDERPYLSLEDYLRWRGRRNKGHLKPRSGTGPVLADWNHWVDENGGECVASLAGIKVGKLDCYLDGYQHRNCPNATEWAKEVSQRESVLESLQVGNSDSSSEEHFRQRVEHWKGLVLVFLTEIYTLREATDSIRRSYFEGQQIMFPAVAEGFDQLLALVEKTVAIYNENVANVIERMERLSDDPGDGRQVSPRIVDLAVLAGDAQESAKEQLAYLVDMAKADALEILGEHRQSFARPRGGGSSSRPKSGDKLRTPRGCVAVQK